MRPVLVLALFGLAGCRSLTTIASEDPTEIRASLPPLPPEQPEPVQQTLPRVLGPHVCFPSEPDDIRPVHLTL